MKKRMDEYSLLGKSGKKKNWKAIIVDSLPRVLIFTVLSFAMLTVLFEYALPFLKDFTVKDITLVELLPTWLFNAICTVASLLLLVPFLYGLLYNNQKTRDMYADMARDNNANILVIMVWTMFRFVIAGFFVFTVLMKFFSYTKWVIVIVAAAIVIVMMFSNHSMKRFTFIESKFFENLNAKENQDTAISENAD